MAERARIVLACVRGKRNDEVASEMGLRPNTVGQWRRRFAEHGIAGLRDASRPGKPRKYGTELRDRILVSLNCPRQRVWRVGTAARWPLR
jgi:transposase